jgi:hypothetical protein
VICDYKIKDLELEIREKGLIFLDVRIRLNELRWLGRFRLIMV